MSFEAPADFLPTFDGRPVQLGIDEAGRGPVVGPMVYGCCYSPIDAAEAVASSGFADSKQLTEQKREALWDLIRADGKVLPIGYIVSVLSAESLSNQMLGRNGGHNLNAISHDCAIAMIRKVQSAGVKIEAVYVDTVGDPDKYCNRLKALFPTVRAIVVCPKADSLFPIVSAASICAKVNRDFSIKYLGSIMKESEKVIERTVGAIEVGSGYPSDDRTKQWLKQAFVDGVFWYPSIVRFSWDTVNQMVSGDLAGTGTTVVEFDFHDEPVDAQQPSLVSMFKKSGQSTAGSKLFENRNMVPAQLGEFLASR